MNRWLAGLALLLIVFVVACGEKAPPPEKFAEGRRLMEAGDFTGAQQYFESEIAAAPADPEPVFLAGQAAAMGARFAEAEAHFNKALELKPETAAYHAWLGRVYGAQARSADLLTQARMAPTIKENFEKAVELDPSDAETKFFLGVFYTVAPKQMGGNPAKAETFATELATTNPLYGHRLLAQIHSSKRNPDGAIAEYQAAAQLAPEDPGSHTDLANAQIAKGDIDAAIASLRKSLELDPHFQPALMGLGTVATKSPDHVASGIEALEQLLALPATILSPNRGQAAYVLGSLYEGQGSTDNALAAYEKSLGLGFAFAQKKIDALKAPAPAAPETTGTMETAAPSAAAPEAAAEPPADATTAPEAAEPGTASPAAAEPLAETSAGEPATETAI